MSEGEVREEDDEGKKANEERVGWRERQDVGLRRGVFEKENVSFEIEFTVTETEERRAHFVDFRERVVVRVFGVGEVEEFVVVSGTSGFREGECTFAVGERSN